RRATSPAFASARRDSTTARCHSRFWSTNALSANCRDNQALPRLDTFLRPGNERCRTSVVRVSKEAIVNTHGPRLRKQVSLYEVLSLAAVLAFTSSSSARAEGGRSSLGARLRSTLSFDMSGGGTTSLFGGVTDPGREP